MEKKIKYPVGQQSFEVLRERDCLYVDKTPFVEKLLDYGSQYFFLARPRRFGKSLFLSMMECFFQGRRELFKGLYADTMDWDWQLHPVLYLDINKESYGEKDSLSQMLDHNLSLWEKEYDITPITDNLASRFSDIILAAYKKTGHQVIILVDEYDKPLVNNLHDNELFVHFRQQLTSIYSNFKSSAKYIRMVFLTGVSRFAHLSVFSGLNNITDISFLDDFADICGITEQELSDNFQQGMGVIAEEEGTTPEQVHDRLKQRYDGYHFTKRCPDIYNPYSLLNVMQSRDMQNYWINSGTPTLLEQQLKRFDVDLNKLLDVKCVQRQLVGFDFDNPNPVALFYQTGYLTIKDYSDGFYTLGLPNEEVREGFLGYLLPRYAHIEDGTEFFVYKFVDELRHGKVDDFMRRMQSLFASVPYQMELDSERNFHNVMLMLVMLLGIKVKAEYATSAGRIDMLLETDKYVYVIELKIDKTAQEALDQSNSKNYALAFSANGRRVVKIGVNFSTTTRTITDWDVESE